MKKYKIYPLHCGTITRDHTNMAYMVTPGVKIHIPLIAWLVTDGVKNILVDTAGTPCDGVHYMPYVQEPGCTLAEQLAAHGVDPEKVETVIMTHLHWDHAGNNALFPNAKFYVQKRELQYAAAPLKVQINSYNYDLVFRTRYEAVEGCCEITEGISVVPTPGHSPGSQSVVIDTEDGKYAIVGDLICLYECMERDPWIINGLHTDLFEYYDSFRIVQENGWKVLPGHEPKVLEHECYPY